ncbi:hypothetical protein DV515_00014610 [Chloebia gouldiae]|uniref:Uncharacterized protein n=1 Tax=Chloebia gouldiae TaxID=44316 RepID=A0A3L8RXI5_CHLGU|nr:hypothetical protein DV515_00014610 [Chloebia gouldiae]
MERDRDIPGILQQLRALGSIPGSASPSLGVECQPVQQEWENLDTSRCSGASQIRTEPPLPRPPRRTLGMNLLSERILCSVTRSASILELQRREGPFGAGCGATLGASISQE